MTSGLDFETNINRGIKYHIPGYYDTSFTIKLPDVIIHTIYLSFNKSILRFFIKKSENNDNKIKSSESEQSLIKNATEIIKEFILSIFIINTPPIS